MLESQWLPDEVMVWLRPASRWVVSSETLFAMISPPSENSQVTGLWQFAKGHLYNHTENEGRKPYRVHVQLIYWNFLSIGICIHERRERKYWKLST